MGRIIGAVRRRLCAVALFAVAACVLWSPPSHAEIIVHIVDAPAEVPRYSPVWLTVSVQNTGPGDELVPSSVHGDGTRVAEIGADPEHLVRWWDLMNVDCFDGCGTVTLLPAGASTLFRFDLSWPPLDAGVHYVRVGLVSGSDCNRRRQDTGARAHCWVGQSFSTIVRIDIREPDSEIDRAALEYLRSPEFPIPCGDRCMDRAIRLGAWELESRFPESRYTWAGIMQSEDLPPEKYAELAESQPTHPLAVYARLRVALAHIDRGEPENVTPALLDQLRLPAPLRAFVEQERRAAIDARNAIRPVHAGARLRIAARLSAPLEGEDPGIRVSLENTGKSAFVTAREIANVQAELLTPGGWQPCWSGKDDHYVSPGWETTEPGAATPLGGLWDYCLTLGGDKPQEGWRLSNNPGVYRVRARWPHRLGGRAIRRGYAPRNAVLEAELVSNEITIDVRRPTGIDAEALAWARAHDTAVYDSKVIDAFPESSYTATWTSTYLFSALNYDAGRLAELMRRGEYLEHRDRPDYGKPPGSQLTGAALARWRIEQSRATLAKHPDFSGADELRLTIAVDQLALGETAVAKRDLRRLARRGPALVSEWATRFLDVFKNGLRGRDALDFTTTLP